MIENNAILSREPSFKDFLTKEKPNRTLLLIAAAAIVIQFLVFKYLYPYASYIHGDSFSYLKAADQNLSINTYLIGYSKFLRLFSVFTRSDFALTGFQYLLIQSSVLFLLFSLFYFYNPGKTVRIVLLIFMVFNPLFLHLANLISSDGFFLALSCIWFTLLLWIIHQPASKIFLWHAIVLFLAFTVRYNALIYPVISTVVILLAKLPVKQKIKGISLSIVLCGLFVVFTCFQYKTLTGYWQYSPFSGWQLTNNAMYTYRYVDSASRKPVPARFRVLDNMIRQYFDSTRDHKRFPHEEWQASTVYMWTKSLTLYKYRSMLFPKDTSEKSELKKWASMGPFYKQYGIYIIKSYPWHFLRYFVWPNSQKYYAPPVEFLGDYNSGRNYVQPVAAKWFGYKNVFVKTRMGNSKVWVLSFYPILSGIINVVMLFSLIFYIALKGWTFRKYFTTIILFGGSFWLLNAGFTIFASSAALRFQSFPLILTVTLVALIVDWMVQLMKSLEKKTIIIEDRFLDTLIPNAKI